MSNALLDLNTVASKLASHIKQQSFNKVRLEIDPDLELSECDPQTTEAALLALANTVRELSDCEPLLVVTESHWLEQSEDGELATQQFSVLEVRYRSAENQFTAERPPSWEELQALPTLRHLSETLESIGGMLTLRDRESRPVAFRCYLPARIELAAAAGVSAARGETILLVEDEEFVRNVTREVLQGAGYTVLEASDAESGVRLFRENAGRVDLLLTDVVMPGMDGRELARQLVEHEPNLKAIFMSGYTENAIVRQGFTDARVAYLQKPFTLDTLTRKVRDVLDSGEPFIAAMVPVRELGSSAPSSC